MLSVWKLAKARVQVQRTFEHKGFEMKNDLLLKSLLGTCAMVALVPAIASAPAYAQEQDVETVSAPVAEDETATLQTVVITGSRIRREVASTSAPVTTLSNDVFAERGLTSAADALNQITSLVPQFNQAAGDGTSSGDGQQYAELFGRGAGRTLTLVNGRRFVTTSSGLGAAQVDAACR